MKVLVQRVSRASVRVEGETVASIGRGLLIFVGVERDDPDGDAAWYADKTAELRIFPADGHGMQASLIDVGGEALVVSQFTLAGSTRRGRRPSFDGAAAPERGRLLFEAVARRLGERGVRDATGLVGAMMDVELVNEGPVTFLIDERRSESR